jgi:hypothetical protein
VDFPLTLDYGWHRQRVSDEALADPLAAGWPEVRPCALSIIAPTMKIFAVRNARGIDSARVRSLSIREGFAVRAIFLPIKNESAQGETTAGTLLQISS